MNERYYVAYGSNLNIAQMCQRCPQSIPVASYYLNDWRLLFKGSKTGNYLTIEPAKDSRVPVVVYKISESDEKALDRYEGYPHFYYKKKFTFLKKANGTSEPKECFAYIMDERRKIGIPSVHYIQVCREGYKDYGLDMKYLDEAIRYSTEHAYKYSGEQERLWDEW